MGRWATHRALIMVMIAAEMPLIVQHVALRYQTAGIGGRAPCACRQLSPEASHALRFVPGQVVLKAVPDVPIYYTTNNVSALENTAYLADTATIYDAAKGITIPAG